MTDKERSETVAKLKGRIKNYLKLKDEQVEEIWNTPQAWCNNRKPVSFEASFEDLLYLKRIVFLFVPSEKQLSRRESCM